MRMKVMNDQKLTQIKEDFQLMDKCRDCGRILKSGEGQTCPNCFLNLDLNLDAINMDEVKKELAFIMESFVSDVSTAFTKDPAALSVIEVLAAYPGTQAILLHRLAHFFWTIGMPFIPRYLSNT